MVRREGPTGTATPKNDAPRLGRCPSRASRSGKPSSASGAEVAAYAADFVDSSALVKRNVWETGTAWVRGIPRRRSSTHVYIALITAVEVTSAIARRRGATLSAAQASSLLSQFRKHLAGRYLPSQTTPALVSEATKLANTHRLRAYDAVKLAAALDVYRDWSCNRLGAFVFVSADRERNTAATAEGLAVDDPILHP